jgi:hypothetical protein
MMMLIFIILYLSLNLLDSSPPNNLVLIPYNKSSHTQIIMEGLYTYLLCRLHFNQDKLIRLYFLRPFLHLFTRSSVN